MTSKPCCGDVLIVGYSVGAESSYRVLDATTNKTVAGPFPSLREALRRAEQLRGSGSIWHTSVDRRGRELSPPVKLANWSIRT